MRDKLSNWIEKRRVAGTRLMGNNGAFDIKRDKVILTVVISEGKGWDHVSVSLPDRCPTWGEMAYIKTVFFDDEETVMQLHPPKSTYINNHPHCLHMWRPQNGLIPMPDPLMVGIK